ncbi:MAG: hypothetical protein DWQ04_08120 [Chloroflexi bacterium]|nr:MAG: hypothetical protein DWQ04_08120 [Chloroflexota bacterium]
MEQPAEILIGMGWYSQKEWHKLKAVATDSNALDDTYEDFLKNFAKARNLMKKQGKKTKKVRIIVSDLVNWCAEQKLPVDKKSRSAFVTHKLQSGE